MITHKVGMEHVQERPHVQFNYSHPNKYPYMWRIRYKQVSLSASGIL